MEVMTMLKKCGALWKKKDANKQDFLSGKIDFGVLGVATVMVFPNKKEKPDQPDNAIYLAIGEKDK